MILAIVILALIQIIININSSVKSTAFSCGLAGFYPKKGKKVNIDKLFLLGVMNEERGTDSTGLSIGGTRFTGVKDDKKCRDFIIKIRDEVKNIDLTDQPCILHTRKSTIGFHNEDNCHPFIVTNTNDPNYYFSLAHNGVINNTKEIKDKFLTNIPNVEKHLNIDSHYMLLSLFNSFNGKCDEKEVLEFYKGNAALLYYDSNGTFKVWKGGSNNIEERPMYYIETNEGWYFCSIQNSLKLVFNRNITIELSNNELLTFYNNKLQSSVILKRTHTVEIGHKKYFTVNTDYDWEDYKTSPTKVIKKEVIHPIKDNSPLFHPVVNPISGLYIDRHNKNIIKGIYKITGDMYGKEKLYTLFSNKSTYSNSAIFSDGVIIKSKELYSRLLKKFTVEFYPSVDKYFLGEYPTIANTIVDFIPLFNKEGLYTILYKDKYGKVDYITKHDKKTIVIPTKFSYQDMRVICDGTSMKIENISSYVGYN